MVALDGADELPHALRQLVEAWRKEGASLDEMVARLDALELLAHEERMMLLALAQNAT
jgi:hypothetical protein